MHTACVWCGAFVYCLQQRFPTWGTCTLGVHLPIWRGPFGVSNRREKYIRILIISKYSEYISSTVLKIQGIFVSPKLFVIRNFRGTCSSVQMRKGYMVRKRLGTPGLQVPLFPEPGAVSLMRQYRNRFYSNAGPTRRIRKRRDITKSDPCVRQKNAQDASVCIELKFFCSNQGRFVSLKTTIAECVS